MDQWEYRTEILRAHLEARGTNELIRQKWPDARKVPKFTPETLINDLNRLGAQGWELVSMQPVAPDDDNLIQHSGSGQRSNAYFVVFKRRI